MITPIEPSIGERERGTILVLVTLLLFAILAIAALVIDLGIAFLTGQQMHPATDTAALEGLRFRDETDDATRRARVLELIGVVFDDNLDVDPAAPDPLRFGAGPILSLSGGLGTTNAGALIEVPPLSVYKPNAEGIAMQANPGNEPFGDLVAGAFDADGAALEAADYTRADFDPLGAPDAFLVRMRRTNDRLGLDQVPGVSSAGPPLPFLFGLGTTIHATDPTLYNPRTDGITVRATSIAAARRALHASGGQASVGALPLVPLAIDAAAWNDPSLFAVDGAPHDVLADGSGFFAVELDQAWDADARLGSVGEPAASAAPLAIGDGAGLLPITTPIDGVLRVIGFGVADLEVTGDPPTSILVTKRRGRVFRAGVNAREARSLAALAAEPLLAGAHAALADPVLAAVLVR